MITASGISVIIITCFIILSFQFNPDIRNCNYQFCTHCVVQFYVYNVYFRLNTRSISTLECGIGYITCVEQNQPVFCMGFLQWHLHTSILQSTMLLCQQHFNNGQLSNSVSGIQFTQWLHFLSQIYPKIKLKVL